MRRPFPLLLSPVVLLSLAVGSIVPETPAEPPPLGFSSPEASSQAQNERPAECLAAYEDEEEEGEEAPALSSFETEFIEAAVWGHLGEKMWRNHGVFLTNRLPGRKLVPIWIESPSSVGPNRYEVIVEMMAVATVPSDFPSIDEASLSPREFPRSPEQAVRQQAKKRGPGSWQLTFVVREMSEGVFEVLDVKVTGRPGEPRRPLRISDCPH